jgi:hypothetical protein
MERCGPSLPLGQIWKGADKEHHGETNAHQAIPRIQGNTCKVPSTFRRESTPDSKGDSGAKRRKACTPQQAASFLGVGSKGPFAVEIGSAMKYGFLERPEEGKIQPTDLARKILRPKTQEDEVKGYREAVLKAPEVSDVYKHYRGENLPDETFFRNTLGSKTLPVRYILGADDKE